LFFFCCSSYYPKILFVVVVDVDVDVGGDARKTELSSRFVVLLLL